MKQPQTTVSPFQHRLRIIVVIAGIVTGALSPNAQEPLERDWPRFDEGRRRTSEFMAVGDAMSTGTTDPSTYLMAQRDFEVWLLGSGEEGMAAVEETLKPLLGENRSVGLLRAYLDVAKRQPEIGLLRVSRLLRDACTTQRARADVLWWLDIHRIHDVARFLDRDVMLNAIRLLLADESHYARWCTTSNGAGSVDAREVRFCDVGADTADRLLPDDVHRPREGDATNDLDFKRRWVDREIARRQAREALLELLRNHRTTEFDAGQIAAVLTAWEKLGGTNPPSANPQDALALGRLLLEEFDQAGSSGMAGNILIPAITGRLQAWFGVGEVASQPTDHREVLDWFSRGARELSKRATAPSGVHFLKARWSSLGRELQGD